MQMALDPAHALFDLADHDALSGHRGVIVGYAIAQIGEAGSQLIELAVVPVADVGDRRAFSCGR